MVKERIDIEVTAIDKASANLQRVRQQIQALNSVTERYGKVYGSFGRNIYQGGQLMKQLANETSVIVEKNKLLANAAREAQRNFMSLYFSVLGLTFGLMSVGNAINNFTDSIIDATLTSTNYLGPLAELKAGVEAASNKFLIAVGTSSAFISGFEDGKTVIEEAADNISSFLGENEKLLKTLGFLSIVFKFLLPAITFLGQMFLTVASAVLVVKEVIAPLIGFLGSTAFTTILKIAATIFVMINLFKGLKEGIKNALGPSGVALIQKFGEALKVVLNVVSKIFEVFGKLIEAIGYVTGERIGRALNDIGSMLGLGSETETVNNTTNQTTNIGEVTIVGGSDGYSLFSGMSNKDFYDRFIELMSTQGSVGVPGGG